MGTRPCCRIARNHCLVLQVSLRAKVDLPPDDVYEILIAPDNSAVFKGIKVGTLLPALVFASNISGHPHAHQRKMLCSEGTNLAGSQVQEGAV